MKHISLLSKLAVVIAAGAMAAGCDNRLNGSLPDGGNIIQQKTSISFDDAPLTKALTAAGVKTFAPGDMIAVVYTDTDGQTATYITQPLTAEDIHNDGRTADINVTLTNPQPNGDLTYVYPSLYYSGNKVDYGLLTGQLGSVDELGNRLDLALYEGKLTAEAELPASATLVNPLAILELHFLNADGSCEITNGIKQFKLSDGSRSYTVRPYANEFDGAAYVAMLPVRSDQTLTFTFWGSDVATVVTGKTLEAGHIYPVGLKIGAVVNLDEVTSTDANGQKFYAAQCGDVLSNENEESMYVTVADEAVVTLNTVCFHASEHSDHAPIHCFGNATLILSGDSVNSVSGGWNSGWSTVYVPDRHTLTISGTGYLSADSSNGTGAGIGAGYDSASNTPHDCGNIVITGGTIRAEGGSQAAGIGSTVNSKCGDIIISGGNILLAGGGTYGAGIGTGPQGTCGNITISGGRIGNEPDDPFFHYQGARGGFYAAGIGCGNKGKCGLITIGAGVESVTVTIAKQNNGLQFIGQSAPWDKCAGVVIEDGIELLVSEEKMVVYGHSE